MTLSGGVSTVSGISVGLSSLTVSACVFGIVGGSVVVSALIGAIGVSTIVSVVVSGTGLCSGRSMAVGSVVSVFGVSMTGSVSLVVGPQLLPLPAYLQQSFPLARFAYLTRFPQALPPNTRSSEAPAAG